MAEVPTMTKEWAVLDRDGTILFTFRAVWKPTLTKIQEEKGWHAVSINDVSLPESEEK